MKKIISLLLVCILVMSCTACGLHQGDPENQEAKLMEFVKKHYGEAEILEKKTEILDTASIYRLKDKQDGFEYPMTAMEVYMSDLGFVSSEDENANAKTLVFDGQFTMKYVSNLVQNKVPHDEFQQVCADYPNLMDVSIFTYEKTVNNAFTVDTEETAMMMKEMDETAISTMASLLKKYDDRKILNYYIMPIYAAEEKDGGVSIKYDETDNAMLLGYYDFFFDYIMKPEEFDGVGTLHDYLMEGDYKNIEIKAVNADIPQSAIDVEEGFEFLPSVVDDGTFIILEIDGVAYEFFTLPGAREFDTETDDYGIHQGSFLDVMATERSGARDVMIAYYATVYPHNFTQMSLHLKPVELTSSGTNPEEQPITPENTEGTTE